MRIDAPIITGSFSLNGSTLGSLTSVATTGSNTFLGGQSATSFAGDQLTANDRAYLRRIDGIAGTTIEVIAPISASAGITGSTNFDTIVNKPTLVSGSSQVIDILSSLNSATASFTPRISNLESKSASVDISITNINSYTSSQDTKNTTLGSYTGSNDTKWTSIGNLTGSYATTGSNTFFGTQTYSGSVYIANDLVVQGSSSIQYISASSVSIGTNIVQLNTANPSVRFAGLTIIDSGSIGGSGSFLYDSVHDEFIFVHRGNGTNVTSSHFVLGPETYDSLGNETYLTTNILTKGTGKEHLVDSCIFDNGTTICLTGNTIGTGTMCIGGNTTFGNCVGIGTLTPGAKLEIQSPRNSTLLRLTATSGENWDFKNCNIVSSTDILSIGATGATANLNLKDDGSVGVGIISPQALLHVNGNVISEGCFFSGAPDNLRIFAGHWSTTSGNSNCYLVFQAGGGSTSFGTPTGWGGSASIYTLNQTRLSISCTGVACFSNTVCAASTYLGGCASVGGTTYDFGFEVLSTKQVAITSNNTFSAHLNLIFNRDNTGGTRNCFNILTDQNAAYLRTLGSFPLVLNTNNQERLTIASNGISTFSCQVCVTQNLIITGEGMFINRPAVSSGEPYIFWQKDGVTRGSIYGADGTAGLRYFSDVNIFYGNVVPDANNTRCLGCSTVAWAHIYTNDLHLSNMTKCGGNDIDGTNGNWTIQEGAENLYIINNKNNKKFKIQLQEII